MLALILIGAIGQFITYGLDTGLRVWEPWGIFTRLSSSGGCREGRLGMGFGEFAA